MLGGLCDAGSVLLSPVPDPIGIVSKGAAKTAFPFVRFTCLDKRSAGSSASRLAPLLDTLALHIGNLSQHGQNQLTDPATDHAESIHVNADTLFEKGANGRLNVKRVTPQTINGIDEHRVTLSDEFQQVGKAGALGSGD